MGLSDVFIWTEERRTEKVATLISSHRTPDDIALAVKLIGKGVSLKPRLNDTPLLTHAAGQGLTSVVEALIKKGADVGFSDEGSTAARYAAMFGRTDTLRVLLDAGADLNQRNRFGATLLWAAMKYPETLRFLVAAGAEVDARDEEGRTPLMLGAAYGDNPESLRTLVALGTDLTATDNEGRTALDHAKNNSNKDKQPEIRNIMFAAMTEIMANFADKRDAAQQAVDELLASNMATKNNVNILKPLVFRRRTFTHA